MKQETKMEKATTSKTNGQEMCQLCNISQRRYTCPKCDVPYCSLQCYKSASHSECSESFYKDCVESELKLQERDPESRRRMIDILKRMQAEDIDFEDDLYDEDSTNLVDSDDEEDVSGLITTRKLNKDYPDTDSTFGSKLKIPDLSQRLESIDLDNADEIWSALSEAERQEFEATLRNGDATKFVPQWMPWWADTSDRKIIEEIDENNPEPEYARKCPKIIDVPAINELAKASPFVRFNLLNVLHAYAYMVLHFNGDHQNSAKESVGIILQLSDNMSDNKIYEDPTSAISGVTQKIIDCPSLAGDEEATAATEEAVNLIINGPEKSNPTFYVSAALSDLHELFLNAKKELSSRQERASERTFARKFCVGGIGPELTKKTLLLCTKKIEYYLSWVKKYGIRVDE